MNIFRIAPGLGLISFALVISNVTFAQNYPVRPVRIVCAEPGASNDFLSRVVAQGISEPLGQQVIVDNRATAVVVDLVARATPDGYTLLVTTGGMWISPALGTVTYNPTKDFTPVTLAVASPNVLVVHPSVAVNSVKDLIALAKANPGKLNYSSGDTGSASHLSAELFKAMAGLNIVRIPYRGAGPAVIGLVSGQVQMMIVSAGSVTPHIKANRLKALAVSSAQPTALMPGLPTIAASGVPGYSYSTVNAMFAPAKTPMAVVNRLNEVVVKALNRADIKEKLFGAGMDVVGSSPSDSMATIKADMAKMGKVIKDAGIHAE